MDMIKSGRLCKEILETGIPPSWTSGLKMQSLYTLEEKGYKKKVTWKQSSISEDMIGIFADEPIYKGEVWRHYYHMENIIVFKDTSDLPPLTPSTVEYLEKYVFQAHNVCAVLIPGDSINHSADPNTMSVLISDTEMLGVAIRDIAEGEELVIDYNDFGKPPSWFVDFLQEHNEINVLNFKGYNDFV